MKWFCRSAKMRCHRKKWAGDVPCSRCCGFKEAS